MSKYELALIRNADAVMLGGKSFREFASYWPKVPNSPNVNAFEAAFAKEINRIRKIAVSRKLKDTNWGNTEKILRSLTPASVRELK